MMLNLYIFSHIFDNDAISSLLRFKENHLEDDYYIFARKLIKFATTRYTEEDIIKEYILRTMLEELNLPDISNLRNFLRHDIKVIYNEILSYDWNSLFTECGFLPMKDITLPKTNCEIPGYTSSIEAMINCTSNEALGGAILAHAESFGTGKEIFM